MTGLEPVDTSSARCGRRMLLRGLLGATLSPWLLAGAARLDAAAGDQAADVRDAIMVVKDDLVAAGHILSNENVIDAFGHISARHPTQSDHFLMCRARAPGLSGLADMMEFDRDGEAVDGQGRRPNIERYIHAGIYQLRADVRSVVHNHSFEVIAAEAGWLADQGEFLCAT